MISPSLYKTSSGGQDIHLFISSQLCTQLLFLGSLILTLTSASFLCGPSVPLPLSFILPHFRRGSYGNSLTGLRKGTETDSRKFLVLGLPNPLLRPRPPISYPSMWVYQRAEV